MTVAAAFQTVVDEIKLEMMKIRWLQRKMSSAQYKELHVYILHLQKATITYTFMYHNIFVHVCNYQRMDFICTIIKLVTITDKKWQIKIK